MIKIITKRHYEDIQSSMAQKQARIRELESELDKYKRGESGEYAFATAKELKGEQE